MKKFIILSVAAALVVLLFPNFAPALMTNSGVLVGTYSGHEKNYDLQSLLERVSGTDLAGISFSKDDDGDFNIAIEELTELGDPNQWGSFSSDHELVGYTLKGGNGFALYYLDNPISSGYWNMEDLRNGGGQIPGLSHFIGGGSITPVTPVPEPATMLLLGTGLIGLAAASRKKLKK